MRQLILIELGDIEDGCVDCKMNQQSQKCKAGFLRSPMSVIKRGDIRYHRSDICRMSSIIRSCHSCYLRKALTLNNWCRKFKSGIEANYECVSKSHENWTAPTRENYMKDLREELDEE